MRLRFSRARLARANCATRSGLGTRAVRPLRELGASLGYRRNVFNPQRIFWGNQQTLLAARK